MHASLPMRILEGIDPAALPLADLVDAGEPVVLRGIASGWPLVQAGLGGVHDAMVYLCSVDAGAPIQYSFGGPEIAGRPFYSADFTRLNFEVRRGLLAQVLEEIATTLHAPRPPTYYVASLPIARALLPAFAQANDAGLAKQGIDATASIWIGNRVTASCGTIFQLFHLRRTTCPIFSSLEK